MAKRRKYRKKTKKALSVNVTPIVSGGAVGYMALARKPAQGYTDSPLEIATSARPLAEKVQLGSAIIGQNIKETWPQMLLVGVGLPLVVSVLKKAVGTRNLPGIRVPGAFSIKP